MNNTKWKVIQRMDFMKQDSDANFVLVHKTIVAPHFVEVISYALDGSPKKFYPVIEAKDNFVKVSETIPKGEKISVKYYCIVKIKE